MTLKLRGDTVANWAAVNPVLAEREMGIETDTRRLKVGDGSTAWNVLPYMAGGEGGSGGPVSWAEVNGKPSAYPPEPHGHSIAEVSGLQGALDGKQAALTSGTNLRTVNGNSLLGSGDIAIGGGSGPSAIGDVAGLQAALESRVVWVDCAGSASVGRPAVPGPVYWFNTPEQPANIDSAKGDKWDSTSGLAVADVTGLGERLAAIDSSLDGVADALAAIFGGP